MGREKLATALGIAVRGCKSLPAKDRVSIYNRMMAELAALISDVTTDPACVPQLIEAERIVANDYNPNSVASPELDLLELSMREDGITMPVVVATEVDSDGYVLVDGFHRHLVATRRLGRDWLPCSVLSKTRGQRMVSTVRHNRARGKHQVELMASLVRSMLRLDWPDDEIAKHLGMSPEELLRLRQMVGAAPILAAREYSRSWGNIDE